MPKQLQTALEARRWMVANPTGIITDKYGKTHYWWDANECRFFSESEVVIITDAFAPFTIIDDPTVRDYRTAQTDPITGQQLKPEWFGKPISPLTAAITKRASEATAEAAKRFEAAKKQPQKSEWVSVRVDIHLDTKTIRGRLERVFQGQKAIDFWYPNHAMKHIYQHAQQVRIMWPGWLHKNCQSLISNVRRRKNAKEILFALQIGAIVEYLPKEGE